MDLDHFFRLKEPSQQLMEQTDHTADVDSTSFGQEMEYCGNRKLNIFLL